MQKALVKDHLELALVAFVNIRTKVMTGVGRAMKTRGASLTEDVIARRAHPAMVE